LLGLNDRTELAIERIRRETVERLADYSSDSTMRCSSGLWHVSVVGYDMLTPQKSFDSITSGPFVEAHGKAMFVEYIAMDVQVAGAASPVMYS
jgi:hypothetical protein